MFVAIEVEENKEFLIKSSLSFIKGVEAYIPFEKKIGLVDGVKTYFYSKLLPSYILLKLDKMDESLLGKISSIKNIEGFVKIDRRAMPAVIDKEEADRYIKEYDYEEIYNTLNGELIIIAGTYAGKTCKIKSKKEDYYVVTVNTRNSPELKIPIWYLGKIV